MFLFIEIRTGNPLDGNIPPPSCEKFPLPTNPPSSLYPAVQGRTQYYYSARRSDLQKTGLGGNLSGKNTSQQKIQNIFFYFYIFCKLHFF